ncbi:type I-E CRISPR-associated protein Cse2/CasB [Streptomyces rubrolavendulae]|uniref:CRISPR-associated protein Cse2 (CRISPR_cse2) n=1 Tax=Streptomyces rubrolavendulae TaxID=285473 RepID=A0A1D8G8G4_9ACTN|nr:type I-E CRISPR-associated protein Cse2/CasB [Streptomyces rubrolavendulae]AOT61734.1 CRISPR-associated protein Cse2 (CRISPR_cse2) [Streptomyces rubrolavendulae]
MTSTSAARPGPAAADEALSRPAASLPHRAVSRTIGRLQSAYQRDVPGAVAAVARLRREAGRDGYASPTAWGLDHLETLAELREEQRTTESEEPGGTGPAPSYFVSSAHMRYREQEQREDTAVHIAVTLWALHQQSLREEPMHRAQWSLGRSVRRLAHGRTGARDHEESYGGLSAAPAAERVEEASETVRQRFVRIGGASDTEVLATRLREMVLLLRSARIPLDYALLADQLLLWQDENRRDEVRRAWGRDFHRRHGLRGTAHAHHGLDESGAGAVPAETDLEAVDLDS